MASKKSTTKHSSTKRGAIPRSSVSKGRLTRKSLFHRLRSVKNWARISMASATAIAGVVTLMVAKSDNFFTRIQAVTSKYFEPAIKTRPIPQKIKPVIHTTTESVQRGEITVRVIPPEDSEVHFTVTITVGTGRDQTIDVDVGDQLRRKDNR